MVHCRYHAVLPYHDFSSINFLLGSGMCFYQTNKCSIESHTPLPLRIHVANAFAAGLLWAPSVRKEDSERKLQSGSRKYVASRCFEIDLQLVIQITSEVSWKQNTKTSWKGSGTKFETVCLHQTAQHPVSLPLLLLNLEVKNVVRR